MDLDDLDGPSKVPSRVSRFAPRSSKIKPQPKPEPPRPSEPEPEPHPESQNTEISEKKGSDGDIKPKIENLAPKPEPPSAVNGAVKMEIEEPKPLAAAVGNGSMDVDKEDEAEEEEEDMIVREIDVYFTPSIDADTQLYVMQYPLRPSWRPYELDDRCEEVRVKPGSAEMEVDLSVHESTNWDHDCASKMKMTKQMLSSSFGASRTSSCAVGLLTGNKLHLNPVFAVVQLRPYLHHLKSSGPKRKDNGTSDPEVSVKLEDSNDRKSIGSSKKQNKRVESQSEQKSDVEECWIPLRYHGSKSDFSTRYLQKIVAQESSPINFTMSPYDYLSSMCPGASNDNLRSKGPSKRVLLSLPLEERVKKLLLEGPPVRRFNAFKHFAADTSIEDLLTALQKHAQLVQGLWAPKTNLLFPDGGGIKSAARDYVLLLFSKKSVISYSELDFPVKIKDALKVFLNVFAVERPSLKDWKFKEKLDEDFIKLYPEIVEKQNGTWEVAEKKISGYFNRAPKAGPSTKDTISKSMANPVRSVHSDKTAIKSASGLRNRTTMTDENREALRKLLPKVFQNHKVCSFQLILQGLRDLAISKATSPKSDPRMVVAAASAADASPEELQEVISEVTTNIYGSYVLKSSPDHPEYDPLRKVVIDLLLARGQNAKLKRAEILEAARLSLKRDVTNNEYSKVMTEICESKNSAWVLKSGDGKPS